MKDTAKTHTGRPVVSNAEIADRLLSLAQLLSTQKENTFKVKAYRRAAATIRILAESVEELVNEKADLTAYPGIGDSIAGAMREIVLTGTLGTLEKLRANAGPDLLDISQYPRLDPKRVLRVYRKLGIGSIEALRAALESGEVEKALGARMAQHVRLGLTETHAMLLYRADGACDAIEEFLVGKCGVRRAQVAGDYRRRVEVIEEIALVIQTDDFASVVAKLQRFGGRTPLVSSGKGQALFALSSGIRLNIRAATDEDWGSALIFCTGSKSHLRKLARKVAPSGGGLKALREAGPFPSEIALYDRFGLSFIDPELREGHDEVDRAATGSLPVLVSPADIRGELHAHSTSSDGAHSIEQMADAAMKRGYEYIGITDHSQSLKLAGGLSVDELWQQIRVIDGLNEREGRIRILKSAEVDILADGSLDYPGELLRELDYTVCSIHSRFGMSKAEQTERIMRAMDNRYFNILGHATGRLLLTRPGYEIDIDRLVEHSRQNGCFFEINSSPNRLDLSAEHARIAATAGVMIAVSTDAHSTGEFALVRCGIDQARRAGLAKSSILNCQSWETLERLFRR